MNATPPMEWTAAVSTKTTKARILAVSCGPPFAASTWSGSSLGLFEALRTAGFVNDAFGAGPSRGDLRLTQALTFSPDFERWRARYRSSVWPARFSSRRARLALARVPAGSYDAILQLGPYLKHADTPIFSYHDDELSAALGLDRVGIDDARARLRYERPYYHAMRRIFMMSSWAADVLSEYHDVPRERIEVVGAGSNIGEDLLLGERDYSGAHFLFVGRDFERKGGPDVLRAFARLRKDIPTARLTIVGAPGAGKDLAGVDSVGLIALAGDAGKRRMAQFYRSASAFVMPSAYEPFGIAFLEAMAAGLPCIGTNRCAMPEIIGDTGFTVPSGDVTALARAMHDIAFDPSATAQLGARARERYLDRYGWSRVACRIGVAVDAARETSCGDR